MEMAGRWMSRLPDSMVDKEYWKKLSDRVASGSSVAEEIIGVDPARAAIFRKTMEDADKYYDSFDENLSKGNYWESAKNFVNFVKEYVTVIPEMLGQSTAQTVSSAGVVTIPAGTTADTYSITIKATDTTTGSNKSANYTIVINKLVAEITCSNKTYNKKII